MKYVVDASVVAKWMRIEEFSEQAMTLRTPAHQLIAPDLLYIEVANLLRTWVRARVMPEPTGVQLVAALPSLGVQTTASALLLDAAFGIATRFERSVYESLYLALGRREGCRVITADRKLFNAVSGLDSEVLWIGDLPPAAP